MGIRLQPLKKLLQRPTVQATGKDRILAQLAIQRAVALDPSYMPPGALRAPTKWWWETDKQRIVEVRYGTTPIRQYAIGKGDSLVEALDAIQEAIVKGDLDKEIAQAEAQAKKDIDKKLGK